jgi:hypothetical protein
VISPDSNSRFSVSLSFIMPPMSLSAFATWTIPVGWSESCSPYPVS